MSKHADLVESVFEVLGYKSNRGDSFINETNVFW